MMDFADGSGERYLNATHRAPCATSQINPTVTVCQPVDGAYAHGNAYTAAKTITVQ